MMPVAVQMAVALLGSAQTPPSLVAEYFPLTPGTRWTFEEKTGRNTAFSRDEVMAAVEVDGKPAFPVRTTVEGQVVDTRYYRIEGDTVFIVAYDVKRPLQPPQPILRVSTGRTQWSYAGQVPFLGGPVRMELSGTSVPKGRRTVLGEGRESLEVNIEATFEPDAEMRVISRQTAVYARGVGLVEMSERRTISRSTTETRFRLVRFEPAK